MRTVLKILVGVVVIVGLIFYWFVSKLADVYSSTYNVVELASVEKGNLYIKTENRGVTGDHQLTIITTEDSDEFEIDSTKQIVFEGLEPFLYKTSHDTLYLTVRQKSKIPEDFDSRWVIIQTEVDNPTMIDLIRNPDLKRI